ncbi:MAG: type IV toxin-antitoxin system AbiEi family antitoxin [Candidatus Omnitrophota bacterium]|nr:type IV toxin-antitoxin system AbiEi family antitoxin [Candidatus Omnitrophota bacterium]
MKTDNSVNSDLPLQEEGLGTREAFVRRLPRLLPSLRVTALRTRGRAGARSPELILQVVTPSGRRRQLYVGLRSAAVPSRIREAARQLKAAGQLTSRPARRGRGSRTRPLMGYPVLAATFLSPRAREICREENVGYLDLAGNCWLQFDDLYVEKVVEKNPFPHRGRPPSVFSPVSSRIVRAVLEEPQRTWQVGELARAARVSLGQTSNVTRRLIAEEYASRADRGAPRAEPVAPTITPRVPAPARAGVGPGGRHPAHLPAAVNPTGPPWFRSASPNETERTGARWRGRLRLTQPARLLDAWRERYVPARTSMAYYSFARPPEQLIAQVAEAAARERLRYALTSFAASSLLAPFVRGIGTVQWYVHARDDVERWVKALDLRPVESGPNVILLIAEDPAIFYRTQVVQGATLVGTIQLYLDLLQEPSRGVEQAQFLRRERIGF